MWSGALPKTRTTILWTARKSPSSSATGLWTSEAKKAFPCWPKPRWNLPPKLIPKKNSRRRHAVRFGCKHLLLSPDSFPFMSCPSLPVPEAIWTIPLPGRSKFPTAPLPPQIISCASAETVWSPNITTVTFCSLLIPTRSRLVSLVYSCLTETDIPFKT